MGLAVGLATGARAQPPPFAGLVVQMGDGTVHSFCMPLAGDRTTGEQLLRRSGLALVADATPLGTLVCRIEGDGCAWPAESCWCQCRFLTGECRYWAYSTLENGAWRYSVLGAGARQVAPGDVDGWAWGVGGLTRGAAPPVIPFETVCRAEIAAARAGGTSRGPSQPATPATPTTGRSTARPIGVATSGGALAATRTAAARGAAGAGVPGGQPTGTPPVLAGLARTGSADVDAATSKPGAEDEEAETLAENTVHAGSVHAGSAGDGSTGERVGQSRAGTSVAGAARVGDVDGASSPPSIASSNASDGGASAASDSGQRASRPPTGSRRTAVPPPRAEPGAVAPSAAEDDVANARDDPSSGDGGADVPLTVWLLFIALAAGLVFGAARLGRG